VTDLVTFIRARLAEREALYRKFVQPPADPPGGPHESWAMRDVAAKRAIVDAYENAVDMQDQPPYIAGLTYAIAEIATVDENHPDYDESWRP
jgi:hypothetical protein